MATFGERFKKLRKEKNYTQEELANKFHTTKSSISKYENNRSIPEVPTLEKYANFFNVSVDYLLGRTDRRQSESVLIDEIKSEEEKKIEIIRQAVSDDPELLEMWDSVSARDDLVMLFKQTKNLSPEAIKSIIQFIKAIEDEERD